MSVSELYVVDLPALAAPASLHSLHHEFAALNATSVLTLRRQPPQDLLDRHLFEIPVGLVVVYRLRQGQLVREANDLSG